MNENKISIDLVDPKDLSSFDFFQCSADNSHIVEQPLICVEEKCQQLICRSCYFSRGNCPICGSKINTPEADIPISLRNILFKLYLKCENRGKGCLVEIDYENFRNHTRNCKFKQPKELTNQNQKEFTCQPETGITKVTNQTIFLEKESSINIKEEVKEFENIEEKNKIKKSEKGNNMFSQIHNPYRFKQTTEKSSFEEIYDAPKNNEKPQSQQDIKVEITEIKKEPNSSFFEDLSDDQLKEFSLIDYNILPKEKLSLMLKKREIQNGGTKNELIMKLINYLLSLKRNKMPRLENNSKKIHKEINNKEKNLESWIQLKKIKYEKKKIEEMQKILVKNSLFQEKIDAISKILDQEKNISTINVFK